MCYTSWKENQYYLKKKHVQRAMGSFFSYFLKNSKLQYNSYAVITSHLVWLWKYIFCSAGKTIHYFLFQNDKNVKILHYVN